MPYGTVGGQSAIGAKAAARIYFNKRLGQLSLREAAMLAGLPQAPSLYSPLRSPGAAKARRNDVLREMARSGMITQATAEKTMRRGLGLDPSTYFTRRRESYFFDYVKDELIKEYGASTVRLGGLQVRTTVDLKKQQEARAAIAERLGDIGPSSAIVTINPKNGYIEAMASSAGYGESKFNLAAQGHRQPGSTFKVMALMAALRAGVDPDATHYTSKSPTKFDDPTYGPIDVSTYADTSAGNISLRKATLLSDNSVYIQLALDVGPDKVKQAAWDLGIRSKLNGYPAETLGGLTDGVSPLEMANAYATIASGGYRNRPTAITRVTFPDGRKELPARWKVKRTKAFEDGVTAKATEILEQNMHQRHRHQGADRLPGRRQDRHHRRVHRRVVRRLHAAAGDRGLGRLPQRPHADARALPRRQRRRRHVPVGDLAHVHDRRPRASSAATSRRPRRRSPSQPFFGRYTTSGGGKGNPTEGGDEDSTLEPARARRRRSRPRTRPTTPAPRAGRRTGGDDKGFDPEKYEAPPQEPPGNGGGDTANGDGDGGGTQAPRLIPGADRCTGRRPGWYKSAPSEPRRDGEEACGKAVPGSTTSRITIYL